METEMAVTESISPTSVYSVLPAFNVSVVPSSVKDKGVSLEKHVLTTGSGRNVLGRRKPQ